MIVCLSYYKAKACQILKTAVIQAGFLFTFVFMKRFTGLLFIIASLNTQAQVTTYYDWQWKPCDVSLARFYAVIKKTDSGWYRNDYFIATQKLQMAGLYQDADTEKQNGWFRYFHPNGNLSSAGRYTNGKKEGLWLSYHYNGMMNDSAFYEADKLKGTKIGWYNNGFMSDSADYTSDGKAVYVSWFDDGNASSAGRYSNGKKEGTWQYFHKNGHNAALEKYRQDILLSRTYYDENGTQLADTSNKDRDAEFKGGEKKWQEYLTGSLQFPEDVKLVNTDVITVVVDATIDEEGKISDVYVSVPFDPKFDDEALRVMKRSPKWLPAIRQNRRVKSYIRQPISFRQEE
jgi:antitoxin component YwqK of YwqJK toxin-antitoxin module